MREGLKQMTDVKKCVNNPPCLVKHVLQNICLVTKHGRTQCKLLRFVRQFRWSTIQWRHEERLIAAKNPSNNNCLKLRSGKLSMSFSQPVKQTIQKIKGLGLKPGLFDLFFVLSTHLKFRASGYSQDRLIAE